MRRLIVAGLIALGLAVFAGAGVAAADPITCPPGQTSEKTSPGVFECVNNGGSGDPNTEDPRNPNR